VFNVEKGTLNMTLTSHAKECFGGGLDDRRVDSVPSMHDQDQLLR